MEAVRLVCLRPRQRLVPLARMVTLDAEERAEAAVDLPSMRRPLAQWAETAEVMEGVAVAVGADIIPDLAGRVAPEVSVRSTSSPPK